MATNLDTEYLEYTEAERLATKAYFDNLEMLARLEMAERLQGDGAHLERETIAEHRSWCIGCIGCFQI